jgi:hypothetical protein
MVEGMLVVHGWLLIGVVFTAVIHMLGSSVLSLKSFQCKNGLSVYGLIVSVLAALALGTAVLAERAWGGVGGTAVLALFCLSQPIVLKLPEQCFRHQKFWLASNSSIVALPAFVLAQQVALFIG